MKPDKRVLAVSSELPWPLDCGGHLRTFHLLRAVASEFAVTLVAGWNPDETDAIDNLEAHGISVRPVRMERRRGVEALRAAACALRRRPYVLFGRHDRRAMRSAIREYTAAHTPAAVYLDHLDSFVFAPLLPRVPRLIDLHNVYSLLVRREADERHPWWMRAYLRQESTLLGRAERQAVTSVDAVFAVSESERRWYEALGARATHLVPNGVDSGRYSYLPTGRSAEHPVILYLGSMSWAPNVEAVLVLAREVLPQLRQRFPDLRLRIVGRDPAPEISALQGTAGVEVTGPVYDVRPALHEATILAVPLRAGGGTRLKILEAFAAGLPVVSSTVGCEGLDVVDGAHLLIADRDRFGEAVATILDDDALRHGIAVRAREMVRRTYDWAAIGRRACNAIAELVGEPQADAVKIRRAG